jgi:hypothetical protein
MVAGTLPIPRRLGAELVHEFVEGVADLAVLLLREPLQFGVELPLILS